MTTTTKTIDDELAELEAKRAVICAEMGKLYEQSAALYDQCQKLREEIAERELAKSGQPNWPFLLEEQNSMVTYKALDNRVPFEAFEARWNTYHGNRAGNVRNARMLREGRPDLVIAFEGGSGTQDMICKTLAAGIPVLVVSSTGLIRRLGADKDVAL